MWMAMMMAMMMADTQTFFDDGDDGDDGDDVTPVPCCAPPVQVREQGHLCSQ